VGTCLALAALGRLVAPRSKKAFADWWAGTGDRFTKISGKVLDHRKFWDAMHTVDADALQDISARLAARMIEGFDLDTSSVALDMTNFATYIDTTNDKAPIAQRGKAKQKRTDLRLVGLGMVVTRAGGIPLVWHAYPGNRPDVTQFPTLIEHLTQRYTNLADTDDNAGTIWPSMTVVFDAGQNSTANFEHLRQSGLHYVGSVPPSDCPDLLALPAADRKPVDNKRYPGLTAIDTRREVYGQHRRVVLTHSQTLHEDQARSFTDTTTSPPRWPAGKPAAPRNNSPPRSRRSPITPGCTPSSTGN
jgi:transposase